MSDLTNVLRVSGKKAGILTLIGDMGKGWVMGFERCSYCKTSGRFSIVALAPFLGHLFSPFLGFKGGKGVATALGSVLGVAPLIGLLLLLAWIAAVVLWRYSSGGALTAFGLFPHPCCISSTDGSLCFVLCARDCAYCDQAQGEY